MGSIHHLGTMDWYYKVNLIKSVGGTITAYYRHNSNGNRVRKIAHKSGGIIEKRVYIGNYELYRKKVNGTLDTERETAFVNDDQKRIAIIDTRNVPTPVEVTIRYQYDNHLGSACLELDSSATIISYEEYHPFGTTSYRAGRNATETGLKRYKYVGKERDEETGLYYYGARYYAAWLCRFVSVDPLQFKYPHYTPYQYAGNKPISFIDLDGMEPAEPNQLFDQLILAFRKRLIESGFFEKKLIQRNSNDNSKISKTKVSFNKGVNQAKVSEYSIEVIKKIGELTGEETIPISSTYRSPEKQINIMYRNTIKLGSESQFKLYGTKGDAVIQAQLDASKQEDATEEKIKVAMLKKANEVGFISAHSSPQYDKINAIDIPLSTFTKKQQEIISTSFKEFNPKIVLIIEKKNNCLHLEIPSPQK